MPLPIEQYALIGDCHTAALVGSDGSIDWLCVPRFDSGACFAALLGAPEHGRWRIGPSGKITAVRRKYREGTLILETEFETAEGRARLTDFMPASQTRFDVVRIVEGLSGRVAMSVELIVRFDYGSIMPWVRRCGDVLLFTAGPDTLELAGTIAVEGQGMKTVAEFSVGAGERQWFTLNYRHSHIDTLPAIDPCQELEEADKLWHKWSGRSNIHSRWQEPVVRSLITLKALQYRPTGGIIAAPTTSLPEQPGGVRNWDYRFCWLRDATFALNALLLAGYIHEATQWREWLLRAVAGSAKDLQILYGITGVRRLDEYEIAWLPGYQGAAPVRVGNAASRQFQLDVYGEVMDTLHLARISGLDPEPEAWNLQVALLEFLESRLAASRRRNLGGPRPATAFHPLEDDGLGGFRSRHQGCRARRPGGAARALEADTRCDPRGGVREGIRRQARLLSSSPTNRRIWMRACCSFRKWGSCRPTIRACSAPSRPSSAN